MYVKGHQPPGTSHDPDGKKCKSNAKSNAKVFTKRWEKKRADSGGVSVARWLEGEEHVSFAVRGAARVQEQLRDQGRARRLESDEFAHNGAQTINV
jgi:hypothetical protein